MPEPFIVKLTRLRAAYSKKESRRLPSWLVRTAADIDGRKQHIGTSRSDGWNHSALWLQRHRSAGFSQLHRIFARALGFIWVSALVRALKRSKRRAPGLFPLTGFIGAAEIIRSSRWDYNFFHWCTRVKTAGTLLSDVSAKQEDGEADKSIY